MTAIPNVTHELDIFRQEGNQLIPYKLVLDSRRVVLSETRSAPTKPAVLHRTPTEQSTGDVPEALTQQVAYYKTRGYGYKIEDGHVTITYVPPAELLLAQLVDPSRPCPAGLPIDQCKGLRDRLAASTKALEESNPDCTDCEKNKLKRRFMDIGRGILQNVGHVNQTPNPGNRELPGPEEQVRSGV